jgi:molybdate transport system substrate-binding protein
VKGRGFSRAVHQERSRALAPAGILTFLLLALTFFAFPCLTASAQQPAPLRIAAAADLQPLLPPLLAQFQQQTGIHVEASYQSSATLAAQIIAGAPFDLFLAADLSFPQRVIDAGRAEESQPLSYARGTLVLWTRNDSGLAALTLDSLRSPAVKTIAIANPEHAPYGRAAQAALQHAGLYESLRPKLVIAENIAQAAQYADSGNSQVGFLSLTSALTPRLRANGHFIRVPAEDYPPIVQGAVVLRGSAASSTAHRFLDFLAQPATRQTLAAEGLEPPR